MSGDSIMSGFFVRFWGVRGSIPTPGHATQRYGGNTACIEVRVGNTLFTVSYTHLTLPTTPYV